MQRVIYLDHNATTPVHPKVLKAMLPYFSECYGNPSSAFHSQSWSTAGAIKNARNQVAALIQADPSEIIFTSGATESINLALKGVFEKELLLITSNIEHAATFEVANWTKKQGAKVLFINVQSNGLINLKDLEQTLKSKAKLKVVSIILAHNEIGSLYNLQKLSQLRRNYDFILHVDATQAVLTESISVKDHYFDMLSLSAHKLYGPKGTGALFLKKESIGHQLQPLISGGGQEFGLRSGTLNVPGIVGLGAACEIVVEQRSTDKSHFKTLSEAFKQLVEKTITNCKFNGDSSQRIYQNISLTLPEQYDSVNLMSLLNGFCISQGAACGSQKLQINPTLDAIGLDESQMKRTLRIGLGRGTKLQDLEKFVDQLKNHV